MLSMVDNMNRILDRVALYFSIRRAINMSKFPEYKHTKSHEYFDRAIKVIPSGIYGHLGPAEGLWVPVSKWPFYSEKAKGTYFLGR